MHRHTTFDKPIQKYDETFGVKSFGLGQACDENLEKLPLVMLMVEGLDGTKLSQTFDKTDFDAFIKSLEEARDVVFKVGG